LARNIEIKAAVADLDALAERAAAIVDDGPYRLEQHDIFFGCDDGRLKLRRFRDGCGELIFYRRPDARGPKVCDYERSAVADPASLARVLEAAWGVRGEVIKTRTLYLAGRTRIHLDRVVGLGNFMELEVVLDTQAPVAHGEAQAEHLMQQLGIATADLVEGAYIDLLAR
jgi:predicted adenylyl cyclase CyaB